VGQLVQHPLLNYRGVIIEVNSSFQQSEEWYEMMACSRPSKTQPWYRVLVHNAFHETYVAEQYLEKDLSCDPVNHPEIDEFFVAFEHGKYL
jgi:heat shock protein HspQ